MFTRRQRQAMGAFFCGDGVGSGPVCGLPAERGPGGTPLALPVLGSERAGGRVTGALGAGAGMMAAHPWHRRAATGPCERPRAASRDPAPPCARSAPLSHRNPPCGRGSGSRGVRGQDRRAAACRQGREGPASPIPRPGRRPWAAGGALVAPRKMHKNGSSSFGGERGIAARPYGRPRRAGCKTFHSTTGSSLKAVPASARVGCATHQLEKEARRRARTAPNPTRTFGGTQSCLDHAAAAASRRPKTPGNHEFRGAKNQKFGVCAHHLNSTESARMGSHHGRSCRS